MISALKVYNWRRVNFNQLELHILCTDMWYWGG